MTFSFTFIFYPFTVELDIWSWSTIWHIMHLIYALYFNIYVKMCLFDVVVALDVKKIEKKCLFLYFLMQNDICRYFPIFSPLLPISFISDPRRYIRRHDICNFDQNPENIFLKRRTSLQRALVGVEWVHNVLSHLSYVKMKWGEVYL